MDTPFVYNKYVTGRNFVGRKTDCAILGNLISASEQVVIYEPSKSGKMSLIQQTLFNLKLSGLGLLVGQLSLLNVRTVRDFACRLGSTALKMLASTPAEFATLIPQFLEGTHFVFDERCFSNKGEVLSCNWDLDQDDLRAVLSLPQKLAKAYEKKILIIITEFQNLDLTEDGETVYKIWEKEMDRIKAEGAQSSYILCGSMYNAMKHIFEEKRFFYRRVERMRLSEVETKDIIDHVVRGFQSSGKVIERDLIIGVCNLLKNNVWYINQMISICDSLSKGFIVESTLVKALNNLISIHEPRMMSIMNSLTTFQTKLLLAILEGNTKFSSSEIIEQYGLNSSANVKRLKDALVKKEIISFENGDEVIIIDPLFEYWIRKYYYEMN